jgi:hypothetical protein
MNYLSISSKIQKLLYFSSGGFCQNPGCNNELYKFFESGCVTNIEELAHVIGQSKKGPRGNADLDLALRDEFNNIILLCPTCHTIIDKNPEEFPIEVLLKWKKDHINKIKSCFIEPLYNSRGELRRVLDKLSIQNRIVFEQYGPYSENYNNILTDIDKIWRKKAIEVIVPNNKKILKLLDTNIHLINENEFIIIEMFREHVREFEYNQISNEPNPYAPIFPKEINNILRG